MPLKHLPHIQASGLRGEVSFCVVEVCCCCCALPVLLLVYRMYVYSEGVVVEAFKVVSCLAAE